MTTSRARDGEGRSLPDVRGPVPGSRSRELAARLGAVESRNVTYLADDFPVFWERASGSNVWDADGNRYVDLTAGFGVAATGHRHPEVVKALRDQAGRLVHGMGDVHPPGIKVDLLEALAREVPVRDPRIVLAGSGSEAVEVALKTARLSTGRPGALAFTGAYHGLSYGALAVTDGERFRGPFEDQLQPHVLRAPYPHPFRPPEALREAAERGGAEALSRTALEEVRRLLDSERGDQVGAVILEPLQGRGGDVVPPDGFLAGLAALCRERGILMILDEIYTGFGRTGLGFACQREGVEPDLLCAGKGFGGGMPISACAGSGSVMEAWPASSGEAMHTSTFLGHPLSCAAALACLDVIREEGLAERAAAVGERWKGQLEDLASEHACLGDVRGAGLMIGLDLVRPDGGRTPAPELAGRIVVEALRRGWLVLAGGPDGNVLSLSPPLDVPERLLERATEVLDELLSSADPPP